MKETGRGAEADNKIKTAKSEYLCNQIKEMKMVVKSLENSLTATEINEKHLLVQKNIDEIKKQRTASQLDEARKENKQLLNILQQKCSENDVSRSQIDVTSAYSTMSMVNLQYKYEELIASYEGLLKVLTTKEKDIRKCYKENDTIREEMNNMYKKLQENECALRKMCEKYIALKQRKERKECVTELRNEKETLRLAHNQVVILLHRLSMKSDRIVTEQLQKALKPERALLLQEIQRSNKLQHENMLLKQEIACLKSKCIFPKLSAIGEDEIKNETCF